MNPDANEFEVGASTYRIDGDRADAAGGPYDGPQGFQRRCHRRSPYSTMRGFVAGGAHQPPRASPNQPFDPNLMLVLVDQFASIRSTRGSPVMAKYLYRLSASTSTLDRQAPSC